MIGVGAIGRPMAEQVLAAGIPLRVFDLAPPQVDALVGLGAIAADSPADAARGCDVVACMVRTDQQLLDVALGDGGQGGAFDAMSPGSVFVVQSTVVPDTIRQLASAAAEHGVGLVDAPVTGGVGGASSGTLVVMAGGSERDVELCRPFLDAMSRSTVHCGPVGAGSVVKLCNNLVGYLSYLAIFEADQLASAAGVDRERLDEVLTTGGLMTQNMQGYLALARGQAGSAEQLAELLPRITELAEKDLGHSIAAAAEFGLELPGSALCQTLMPRIYGLPGADA